MIFEFCKWDPQVGDVAVLSNRPLLLAGNEWNLLTRHAENLYCETLAAEAEIVQSPRLHQSLGLSRFIRNALAETCSDATQHPPRLMRFDFHHTPLGWMISEVNSDVPGGFIESSAFPSLVAEHFPGKTTLGDPARYLAQVIRANDAPFEAIAMVHATAYTDDRQVMVYLSRCFEAEGMRPMLASPADIRWELGAAYVRSRNREHRVDLMVRFFPSEWLPNLPRTCKPRRFFSNESPSIVNPASAIVTQTKRFPLVWKDLKTKLSLWSKLLPETRVVDRERMADESWIVKPALGRVGALIGIHGVTPPQELAKIHATCKRHPAHWVAQKRFCITPVETLNGLEYPSIGVFVIDGRVAGCYGRISSRPIIDDRAKDIVVLIETNNRDQ
ncbi:MAG TPA: glutathionylspermidine synthase family protein [Phycisphaerae bacterium]|nr:glutathionylspermidine synthase family protein [Phycisphaerae bacterium]